MFFDAKISLYAGILMQFLPFAISAAFRDDEIREYSGKKLSPYYREYDASIKGPQHVNIKTYRLAIKGMVENPLSLKYEEVISLPNEKRVETLYCIEGWSERLLFEGVKLSKLLKIARPKAGVKTVIFRAADGYSSSLTYSDVERLDLMLAYKVNGKMLDAKRGFPFQTVASSKWGYKWVKWITEIELTDKDFLGYWERRGYDNDADVDISK